MTEQEVNVGKTINQLGSFIQKKIFQSISFVLKKKFILIPIFLLGWFLGYYLDSKKAYTNEVTVTPNFGSVDYLYAKIELIKSKRKEKDSLFFEANGLANYKNYGNLKIEPIIDVYPFVEDKKENFDLLKLLAENNAIDQVIEDETTSKNFLFHKITFTSKDKITEANVVAPLLNYLNKSEFFEKLKQQETKNYIERIVQIDSSVQQINSIMGQFSRTANNQKASNLVYYNENNQISDVLKVKEEVQFYKSSLTKKLLFFDKVIKDSAITLNSIQEKGLQGKQKWVIPFLFLGVFLLFHFLLQLYNKAKQYNEQ